MVWNGLVAINPKTSDDVKGISVLVAGNYPIAFGLPATVPIITTALPEVCRVCGTFCTVPEVLSPKNVKKQGGMLAFFAYDFYVLRHLWYRKITKICSESDEKETKMEAWGGSGDSWGSSWRHLVPNRTQS